VPKFTIDLTDKAVAALQGVVVEYNDNTGAALTVAAWLDWYVKEACISRQHRNTVTALIEQHQRDAQALLEATIKTAHDELLASLEAP